MKIYLHQTEIKPDSSINIQNLYDVFENNLQADLIVCPEVFTSGFKYDQIEEISRENKDILKKIQYMCSSSKTAFLGSFLWKDGANYFNRAFFIQNSKPLGPGLAGFGSDFFVAHAFRRVGFFHS